MDMHQRLRHAREMAGFQTVEAAAEALGVKYQTYAAHENGSRKFRYDSAKQYARRFKVTPSWLLDGAGEGPKIQLNGEQAVPKTPKTEIRYIPEFNVHVSAGGGALIEEEQQIARWPFLPEYIENYLGLVQAKLTIVEVRGDSMEPTLAHGDKILVNMSDTQISHPGIFVLWDGGGTVVKRLDKRVGNDETVTLISDNPIHDRYEVPLEDINVVGRVVWFGRRL